jgi:hypothetical protein
MIRSFGAVATMRQNRRAGSHSEREYRNAVRGVSEGQLRRGAAYW